MDTPRNMRSTEYKDHSSSFSIEKAALKLDSNLGHSTRSCAADLLSYRMANDHCCIEQMIFYDVSHACLLAAIIVFG